MYKKLIVKTISITGILMTFLSLNVIAKTCDINSAVVKANYSIKVTNVGDNKYKNKVYNEELDLIRNNFEVAYSYPHKNITDVWVKYPNNKVALNRYFEAQKRSIEYQPTELKRKVSWQTKYQFLTFNQLNEMTLITKVGEGCYQQEEYKLTKGNTKVRLSWLPQLNLVKRLEISQPEHTKTWQLGFVESSKDEVKQFFDKRYSYQSTDYADIGDMESDPFLVQMINLGFIDHTPQGFYNSKGENISPDNHRH